jgi:hypothetical protein
MLRWVAAQCKGLTELSINCYGSRFESSFDRFCLHGLFPRLKRLSVTCPKPRLFGSLRDLKYLTDLSVVFPTVEVFSGDNLFWSRYMLEPTTSLNQITRLELSERHTDMRLADFPNVEDVDITLLANQFLSFFASAEQLNVTTLKVSMLYTTSYICRWNPFPLPALSGVRNMEWSMCKLGGVGLWSPAEYRNGIDVLEWLSTLSSVEQLIVQCAPLGEGARSLARLERLKKLRWIYSMRRHPLCHGEFMECGAFTYDPERFLKDVFSEFKEKPNIHVEVY